MSTILGDAGLIVPPPLTRLLSQPGYINISAGGQTARRLFSYASLSFNPQYLNRFALACYCGMLKDIKERIEKGEAPDLITRETPFKTGYASLVVLGAQRIQRGPNSMDHTGTLKFLLSKGCPADLEDITGLTALHHIVQHFCIRSLARILLENGANVNHQNRYGEVPIFAPMQSANEDAIDLLMEFGADLNIPEADGITPRSFIANAGPKAAATITRWLRKRSGKSTLMEEKICKACGTSRSSLKLCSRCRVVRYCSTQCQRSDWRKHKSSCRAMYGSGSLTFKPIYRDDQHFSTSPADMTRAKLGLEGVTVQKHGNFAQVPTSLPKTVTIKKRDFVCMLSRSINPEAYDRIRQTIMDKGLSGLKAYFAAEIQSRDELIVKVDEVLAEQPF